ncbi:hypothetical protein pdam_00001521 [Pocillopora damicornis]|uniref:Uncharacterized protein n=1 Tax=Pocillopora damicornis TaxID=46731 RepID=A0A3M6U5K8_POCDA|nr:hypothetical protein pdam_00001521 [Pocillopora damicornis]
MKYILVTLLFVCAAEAFQSQVHLPEDTVRNKLTELDRYLQARFAHLLKTGDQMNDHHEHEQDEGVMSVEEAVAELADSLNEIVPALETLKEAKDSRNKQKAQEMIHALQFEPSNEAVKTLLGRHVVDDHEKCEKIKEEFVSFLRSKALLQKLKVDELDFEEETGEALEEADLDAHGALAHFNHFGVKGKMGRLLVDSACDKNVDGLIEKIGEIIEKQDPNGTFDLSNRIEPYTDATLVALCERSTSIPWKDLLTKRAIQESAPSEAGDVGKRIIDIVFENPHAGNCIEVKIYKKAVDVIKGSITLQHSWAENLSALKEAQEALIKDVASLMQNGLVAQARRAVGNYMVSIVRGTLVVSHVIEKNGLENTSKEPEKGPEKEPKIKGPKRGPKGEPKEGPKGGPKGRGRKRTFLRHF